MKADERKCFSYIFEACNPFFRESLKRNEFSSLGEIWTLAVRDNMQTLCTTAKKHKPGTLQGNKSQVLKNYIF